ncbi:MAG: hypothetical protein GY732_16790, partial [Gammaproteobacteria bacterium]|nr:hypothetical protein [Gammaproteobacteria bacterium]
MQSDLQHTLWTAWNAATRVSKTVGVITLLWVSSIEADTAQVGRDYLLPTQAKGGFTFSPSSTESNQPSSTESNQSNSTKASTISYKAFDGSTHQLVENRGRYVNVLIPQSYDEGPFFTADHIEEMVDRLDMLYALYTELMQEQPDGNGLLNIAFIPQTCGMGCGLIGAKGFEILSVQRNYEAIISELDAGRLESVLLHEMAHNFDMFSSYLYYLPDHAHAWTDMFEFFAPFRFARFNSHDQVPDDVYNSPVSAVWKKYVTEESANWERCVINGACTDLGMTANNLWAMLYYRIDAIHGIEALLGSFEFLREYVKTRHPPTSDEGKEGLRILSLAMGAGVNISCYMDALKWPIPANVKTELINTFGNNDALCADKDGDGFNTINGDCDDTNASRNIMATEIGDNSSDDEGAGIAEEAHPAKQDARADEDSSQNALQSQVQ